jgi:hypothetical protein
LREINWKTRKGRNELGKKKKYKENWIKRRISGRA